MSDLDADLAMVRAGLFLADLRVPDAFDALDRVEAGARRAEEAEHAAREALQHSDNELHAIIAERTEYLSQRDAAYDVLREFVNADGTWLDTFRHLEVLKARGHARTLLDSITKGEPDA